jgi:hypothetical protein
VTPFALFLAMVLALPAAAPPNPALTVVAPVASPVCANALLATVIAPALGVKLPPQTSTLVAPIVLVCGAVPQPGHQLRCPLDLQAQQTLLKLTETAVGTALPLDIIPEGMVAGTGLAVGDVVPSLKGVTTPVVDVLHCATVTPTAAGAPRSLPTTAPPLAAPTTPTGGEPIAITTAPTPAVAPTAAVTPAPAPVSAAPSIAAAPPVLYRTISRKRPRFAYPIVMIVPLLLLMLGGYLGRALTRPVTVPVDTGAGS